MGDEIRLAGGKVKREDVGGRAGDDLAREPERAAVADRDFAAAPGAIGARRRVERSFLRGPLSFDTVVHLPAWKLTER